MGKKKDFSIIRSRGWTLVLYPDSKSYNFDEVLQAVRSYPDYAFIKHNPDVEEKKFHYHVNIFFQNACSRSALLKKLNLPEDYTLADSIDSVRSINRYLSHIDYPERTQYDFDLITISSHYFKKFKKCYDDLETESEIINKIYFKIDQLIYFDNSYSKIMRDLVSWCCDECYENIYKKYRFEFLEYIKSNI